MNHRYRFALCVLLGMIAGPVCRGEEPSQPTQGNALRPDMVAGPPFAVMFDYNACMLDAETYGKDTNWEELGRYLAEVQPDCVIFHALSCFRWPTLESKYLPTLPGFDLDFARKMKKVCAEAKVPIGLYVASFNYNRELSPTEEQQERWGQIHADGTRFEQFCPNSPWVDEQLAPFCLEALEQFQPVNFIWFDGTYTFPCFCLHCKEKFAKQYGVELKAPTNANERARIELFKDQSAIDGMQRGSELLHAKYPDLVVGWGNVTETHTLRPAFKGQDWVVTDEVNSPSLAITQFEATYRSTLGVPAGLWMPDLARLGDLTHPRPRPRALVMAEAATLTAHGINYLAYHLPPPGGLIGQHLRKLDAATARFIRERASFCLGNESVPHVAVLASRANNYRYPGRFYPFDAGLVAVHEMLSQSHVPFEVVNDDVLANRLDGYQTVVLGEVGVIYPKTAKKLEQFVERGGRLLVLGPAPVVAEPDNIQPDSPRLFDLKSVVSDRIVRHFDGEDVTYVGPLLYTSAPGNVVWRRREVDGKTGEPLLLSRDFGKGRICWLLARVVTEYAGEPFDTVGTGSLGGSDETIEQILNGPNYSEAAGNQSPWSLRPEQIPVDYSGARPIRDLKDPRPHPHLRRLVGDAVRATLGEHWLLRSDAPAGVEFVVNRRDTDLYVHVVNHTFPCQPTAPNTYLPDSIPILADIGVEVRLPQAAVSVELLPKGSDDVKVERQGDVYRIILPRLHMHSAIRFVGGAPQE